MLFTSAVVSGAAGALPGTALITAASRAGLTRGAPTEAMSGMVRRRSATAVAPGWVRAASPVMTMVSGPLYPAPKSLAMRS
jgi:hypothetical protein